MRAYALKELNNTKTLQVIGKIDTLLLLEQLNLMAPHCSVAADVIIPERTAEEVYRIAGDRVLVGPTISYRHTRRFKDRAVSLNLSRRVLRLRV